MSFIAWWPKRRFPERPAWLFSRLISCFCAHFFLHHCRHHIVQQHPRSVHSCPKQSHGWSGRHSTTDWIKVFELNIYINKINFLERKKVKHCLASSPQQHRRMCPSTFTRPPLHNQPSHSKPRQPSLVNSEFLSWLYYFQPCFHWWQIMCCC